MTPDGLLYRACAAACALGGVVGLLGWLRREGAAARRLWIGLGAVLPGLAVAAWIVRWAAVGHMPLFGTYESALSLAVAVLVSGLAWEARSRFRTGLLPVCALVAAALLAHGLAFDPTAYALTISERSWVVDLHALLAWLAFGAMAVNAALAVRQLLIGADDDPWAAWLARSVHVGFALHTGMMVSGSFYKFMLFGKAWSFDPMETMGLIAWLAYGVLVHMTLFGGWRGRRLAGWCLFVFALLVASYRAIAYFPAWSTYHILDMDLRMHVPG